MGVPYTCAIDMWSFGCILGELCIGYPMYPGEDEHEQLAMVMEIFGVPPKEIVEMGARSKKFFGEITNKF